MYKQTKTIYSLIISLFAGENDIEIENENEIDEIDVFSVVYRS